MSKTGPVQAELAGKADEVFWGLWASVFYAPPTPPRAVVVCSTNHREGASLVAGALAMAGASTAAGPAAIAGEESLAATASGVLLVDFNLRTPGLHKLFDLDRSPGLSEVLLGKTLLASAVKHVGPGNLDVLTSGAETEPLLDLLKTDRMRSFFDDLRQRYAYVVVDAPPATPYPDAQVLAALVGTVVLVAQAQRTSREALLQARRRMELGSARVAGVVLNKRTYPIPKFVYKRV